MSTSKKSTVAAIGVVSGAISVGLTIFLANTANSLALWADSAATFLDFAAIFIAWQGFRKVETNSTETFNYGFGKFESFFSMVMAALMFISFFCIMTVAWNRFGHPVAVEGLGVVLGIGMHIIFGVINGFLLFQSLHLEKQEKTPLSSAQRKIFTVKFSANIIMFFSLVLSHFYYRYSWTMYADTVAASIIALMILADATKIFRHSARDLLDYALEEQYQLLILRSLANHFEYYETIHDIRTRVSGGKVYVEIFLEFNGSLPHSEVMKTADSIQTQIRQLLNCDEVLIIPVSG